MKGQNVPHEGQILTTKGFIRRQLLRAYDYEICSNILFCILSGSENTQYLPALLAASMRLNLIQRCVYKGKNGNWKLKPEEYVRELFDGYAETVDECRSILEDRLKKEVCLEKAEYCYQCLSKIKKLLGPMLACSWEILYPAEFAFVIDYVIRRGGRIKDPVFLKNGMFPENFADFDYTAGITETIEEYTVWR